MQLVALNRDHPHETQPATTVDGMRLRTTRWLMTGANGRIGQHLRPHLRERVGHLIVADKEAPDAASDNETATAFDIREPEAFSALLKGCDGVVHLAGIADEAPLTQLLDVNVMGTYQLLEAMRRHGVPRLVNASSNRATGFYPTSSVLDDTATPRPDGFYGVSKVTVEALTRLYSDKFGLQVCNLRIGSFEEVPTNAREAATWLSPADACRAFDAAMTTDEHYAVFYAVSANSHRFWSLEPGQRIGFEPQDDAADILGADVQPDAGPQAGHMASPDFTLRVIE